MPTLNPSDISSPKSGDRVFNFFNVTGTIDPSVGLNVELIANNSLLFDGYTETDLDGNFSLPVSFNPTMVNSKLFLNLTQTGRLGVSNELTITLFQARNEAAPIVPYTARKLSFDDRTTAFYTLSASTQAGRIKTYNVLPTHELSFSDSGTPSGWSLRNGDPVGLLGDGIMTSLGDNVTADSSGLEDTSIDWTDGASYSSSYRATTLPAASDTPIVFLWRHVSSNINNRLGHRVGNDRLDAVTLDHPATHQFVPDDQQNLTPGDWYDIQHYAKRLRNQLGTQHIYVETYVNGELYFTSFATTTGGADQVFLGEPSNRIFANFDINYFWAYQDKDPMIDGPFWSVDGDFNKAFDQSGDPAPSPVLGTTREGLEPPFETALTLNGVDEYLVNNNALFELSNTFTIDFWFSRQGDDTTSTMRIFGKEVINSSSHFGYYLDTRTNGELFFAIAGSGVTNSASIPGVIRNNTWYYCAITYDNQATKIYLDGIKVFDGTTGPYTSSSDEFYIGVDGTTTNIAFFQGQIASLRISNGTIRKESEIYNNYFSNFDYNQKGFKTDAFTVANYNFVNAEDYIYIRSGNEEPITDTEITFSTNKDFKKYFFPVHIFTNSSGSFANAFVENNAVVFKFEHNNSSTNTINMPTKIILNKDFDFQMFISYNDPIQPGSLPSYVARNYFHSNFRRHVLSYADRSFSRFIGLSRFSSNNIDNFISQPNALIFRATCENNDIKFRYGLNSDTEATTEMASLTNISAPNSIVSPTFSSNMSNAAPSQTLKLNIDKITITDREGNSPEDGYAMVDPLLAHVAFFDTLDVRFSKFGGVTPDFNSAGFTVDDHESLNTKEFSVEILFAADTLQSSKLFLRSKDGYTGNVGISLNSSGDFTVDFEDSAGTSGSISNVGTYNVDKPHYVALTYENNKFRFFVDGSQVGSFVGNFDGKFGHDIPFYIGVDRSQHAAAGGGTGSDFFDGEIAHLRWSNKARTPIEIFNFYRGAGLNEST